MKYLCKKGFCCSHSKIRKITPNLTVKLRFDCSQNILTVSPLIIERDCDNDHVSLSQRFNLTEISIFERRKR